MVVVILSNFNKVTTSETGISPTEPDNTCTVQTNHLLFFQVELHLVYIHRINTHLLCFNCKFLSLLPLHFLSVFLTN